MPLTIEQLEAERYFHIECRCRHCHRGAVWVPFKLIRNRRPDLDINDLTIAELGKLMPCGECGSREVDYKEVRQEDAPGYQKYFRGGPN